MKKLLSLTFVILLFVSMTLSSCAFPTTQQQNSNNGTTFSTPLEALTSIEEKMNNQASFEANTVLSMTIEVAGEEMSFSGTGKTIMMQNSEKEITYFYDETDLAVTYADETSYSGEIRAFNNEKFFCMSSEGNEAKRLYSQMTSDEFVEFMNEISENGIDYLDGHRTGSYEKNSDGTHTLKLWKFDEEHVARINSQMGLSEEYTNGVITDYTVTLYADANLLPVQMRVDFAFSNSAFTGNEVITFSKYGTAEKKTDTIAAVDYTKVDDARIIDRLKSFISEKKNSDDDFFVLDSTSKSSYRNQESTSTERDEISYGYGDGGYFFDIDAVVNGTYTTVSYNEGQYRVNGQLYQNQLQNDTDAKMFISNLIDPFSFSAVHVSDVEVYENDDGTVKYTLFLEPVGDLEESFRTAINSSGADYDSTNMTMTVLTENGKITSVNAEVRVVGYVSGNTLYPLIVDTNTTIDFAASRTPDL